jgi:hypothetical protein
MQLTRNAGLRRCVALAVVLRRTESNRCGQVFRWLRSVSRAMDCQPRLASCCPIAILYDRCQISCHSALTRKKHTHMCLIVYSSLILIKPRFPAATSFSSRACSSAICLIRHSLHHTFCLSGWARVGFVYDSGVLAASLGWSSKKSLHQPRCAREGERHES